MYSHIRAYIPLEVDVSPHTGLVLCGDHPVIYHSVNIKLDFLIRVQAVVSVSIIIQHGIARVTKCYSHPYTFHIYMNR